VADFLGSSPLRSGEDGSAMALKIDGRWHETEIQCKGEALSPPFSGWAFLARGPILVH
jgi:hypothetical protein